MQLHKTRQAVENDTDFPPCSSMLVSHTDTLS